MAIKYSDEERTRIEQYILINHEYETTSELTRNLKIPRTQVEHFCEELQVVAATPKELILHYAKGQGKYQSIMEMAQSLKINSRYLAKVLQEQGYEHHPCERERLPATIDLTAPSSAASSDMSQETRDGLCRLMLDLDLKLVQVGYRHWRFVPMGERISGLRPRGEYNMRVVSDVVKEVYEAQGVKIKE